MLGAVKEVTLDRLDTTGLSASGIWVRRVRNHHALSDEALSLAYVMQTWDFSESMIIDSYGATYAEISGPDLLPTWVYLIQLVGWRAETGHLFPNHPLSHVQPGEEVRVTAIVLPSDFLIPGALVETAQRRRMIWLQTALA